MPMLFRMKFLSGRNRIAKGVFTGALVLASFGFSAMASAGTLQLRDSAKILTNSDRSELEAVAGRAPFDVRVLTSTAYADQGAFSRYVGGQVNEANEIVIGIDPEHHHTQVHFGTGSHVARSDWAQIERAGNSAFRDTHWAAGVSSIIGQASSAVRPGVPGEAGRTAESGHGGWLAGGLMGLFFAVGVPILALFLLISLLRRLFGGRAAPVYGGSGYGGPGYGGPGYGGPGYGGGYPGGGGMGPVGGGLIGAGLGGLAGYELGKMEGEREAHSGERHHGGFDNDSRADESFDAGGGGSSWDSGDGGGGGSDSGGGGSDW